MSLWKDKVRKDWRYSFQCKGVCFAAGGFKTKIEARTARAIRQDSVRKEMANLNIPSHIGTIDALRAKYKSLYSDPEFTVADIFNLFAKEIEIPVRFKDLKDFFLANHVKKVPAKLRATILEKNNFKCVWCGRGSDEVILQVDHIIPRSMGGLTEERNLQTLCTECNQGKGYALNWGRSSGKHACRFDEKRGQKRASSRKSGS
ncbi:MAG: HNH endonuclease [Smithella sp.]|jgi:hypothetical protein